MTIDTHELIQRLQKMQRLVQQACAERDQARAEAVQWKQRYEQEYQKNYTDTHKHSAYGKAQINPNSAEKTQDTIKELQAEIQNLKQALKAEKIRHQKTRTSLITSLGDALQHK